MPVITRSQHKKNNFKHSLSYWFYNYIKKNCKQFNSLSTNQFTSFQIHFEKMRILTELYYNICTYIKEVVKEKYLKQEKIDKFIHYNYNKIFTFKAKLKTSTNKPKTAEEFHIQNTFINQLNKTIPILKPYI